MVIFHNPRCAKSRQTLGLMIDHDISPIIFEYLKEPLSPKDLKAVIAKLDIEPFELVRKGEAIYKENYRGKKLSDDQWIEAMVSHPKLIERPIVIDGNRARLGRPPERILELIND